MQRGLRRQNLAVIRELENQTGEKVNMNNWNPNGGAIAYGHANGASGSASACFACRNSSAGAGVSGPSVLAAAAGRAL